VRSELEPEHQQEQEQLVRLLVPASPFARPRAPALHRGISSWEVVSTRLGTSYYITCYTNTTLDAYCIDDVPRCHCIPFGRNHDGMRHVRVPRCVSPFETIHPGFSHRAWSFSSSDSRFELAKRVAGTFDLVPIASTMHSSVPTDQTSIRVWLTAINRPMLGTSCTASRQIRRWIH
jgi:hypothetical protein